MAEGHGLDSTEQLMASAVSELAPCVNPECPVCELNSRLIQGGAESVAWPDLCEHDCHAYVRAGPSRRTLLRIDRAMNVLL